LLKQTGVAGCPEEYFEAQFETGVPPHPRRFLEGLPITGAGVRANVSHPTPPEDPSYTPVLRDLRGRLERWMEDTADPLLDGPVPAPPGARINARDQVSAHERTFTVDASGSPVA
jgi:hypothetical protein